MKTLNIAKLVMLLLATVLIMSACAPTAPATEAPATEEPVSEAKVWRIATDATYPPFETVDEATKEIVGFDIDLLNAIAEEAGITFELVNVGFDPLLTGMAQCQYDAAISAMTITEERQKAFSFTNPYINAGQVVTINKETTGVSGVADLAGKRIGVQIGTTGAIEAEAIEGAEVRTYDTVDLAFQDLANKQVDAVIADYPTSIAFIMVNPEKLMTTGEVFTAEEYGIAVCKTQTELLDALNRGLAAVQANGLIPELEQKWLSGAE